MFQNATVDNNTQQLPILEENPDARPLVPDGQESKPTFPPHIYRTNSRGLIEAVDLHTGKVLCVQSSAFDLLEKKFDRLIKIETAEGPVYLEKGLSVDILKSNPESEFSKLMGDLVCEKVAEGMTLTAAAKSLGIKYSVICRWKRQNAAFREELAEAKKERAEVFHDEVIETARGKVSTKDKIGALQWAAEKGNQKEFGTKKPTESGGSSVTVIQINTGIRRKGDPGFVDVTPKEQETLKRPTEQIAEEEEAIELPGDLSRG